ncbi:protein of unknown function [Burkholderia multivorans]
METTVTSTTFRQPRARIAALRQALCCGSFGPELRSGRGGSCIPSSLMRQSGRSMRRTA